MRALIEARLANAVWRDDPTAQFLARVEGEISAALVQALEQPRAAAAVLLGLVERRGGLTVLFTERAAHLRDHPGQISLPGGRLQSQDASATTAALREAQEEIGLAPSQVAVAGCLAPQVTGTGFLITPVVGFIGPDFEAAPDVSEVASVFEAPLEFVLDQRNVRSAMHERHGSRFRVDELQFGRYRIWGATAAILSSFRDLVLSEKTEGYGEYR